jgi:tetratricopeptide (TPR) repeat protein
MPAPLKRLILDKARGNPLFIEEVAHSLIENYLTLDEATGAYHARADLEQIQVPDSIHRAIMSRMDRLDESSRNVLRVASVIGKQFELWLLSGIYPYRHAEEELREQLDELSQREILEGPHPDLLYLFRHILTREVAYESLLYADRRSLHRRIGECIEAQQAGRLVEYTEVLAYHFGLAEEWNRALEYYLQAGRKAKDVYANQVAIHHFRQALKAAERLTAREDYQLAAHEGLGEVLTTVGRYDEALEHNYQALALVMVTAFSAEDMARRLADLCFRTASIHEKKSSYDTAFNWLRGGQLAMEGMDAVEVARIYLLGAGIYHRQGKNSEAIEWCQRSLDMAEKVGDREGQSAIAHAYYLLGLIYNRLGDTDRTIEFCQKSLDIYEQIGDIPGAAQAHINLGIGHLYHGNWPEASGHYLRALEIKRKIGDVYYQAVITLNLGEVCLNQGNLDQATRYYQESLEMWESLGSSYAIALVHNNMGTVALQKGDMDEARSHLQTSMDMFQQINSGDFMPEVCRHLAEVHLGRQELDEALACVQRSLTLARDQEMRLEEGCARRVVGQVYLARRELAPAEQELQESLSILQKLNSLYEIGKTLFQMARLYQVRGDQAQMQMRLGQAQSIFEGLGARLDLARAQELAREE